MIFVGKNGTKMLHKSKKNAKKMKIFHKKIGGCKFNYSIHTDGFSCTLLYSKKIEIKKEYSINSNMRQYKMR